MKNKIVHIVSILLIILLIPLSLLGCDDDTYTPYRPSNNNQNKDPDTDDPNTPAYKPVSGKRVALTYDDGPYNVTTPKIVDELSKYGYNATFFVLGNRIDGSKYNGSSSVKYALEKGNEIAIHGYTHDVYYDECSDSVYADELNKTHNAILAIDKNVKIKLMRPIGGSITEARITSCKYSVILWSVDSLDWKYKGRSDDETAADNINTIVENIMSGVKDGSIILMHDIYENTNEATKIILKKLNEQGYDVVTVSELLGSELKAGKAYSSAPSMTQVAALPTKKEEI